MSVVLYGIRNCDTMKRAMRWLAEHRVEYRLHDYKRDGIDRHRLSGWVDALGWERVLNRSGTTFRKLSDEKKEALDRDRAIELMLEQPSMIKRPVVEHAGEVWLGFDAGTFEQKLTPG